MPTPAATAPTRKPRSPTTSMARALRSCARAPRSAATTRAPAAAARSTSTATGSFPEDSRSCTTRLPAFRLSAAPAIAGAGPDPCPGNPWLRLRAPPPGRADPTPSPACGSGLGWGQAAGASAQIRPAPPPPAPAGGGTPRPRTPHHPPPPPPSLAGGRAGGGAAGPPPPNAVPPSPPPRAGEGWGGGRRGSRTCSHAGSPTMTTGPSRQVPPAGSLPTVHVVAGVITDTRGRILLARRAPGRELAGLWEFPGGKVEPGESPEAALARELEEELGIGIDVGAPLMTVPHLAPSRHLRLDVRRVAAWRGSAKGREGQALAWVQPEKLPRYDMPAPDRPVVAALLQPDHCLVTPPPDLDDEAWLAGLGAALDRGVRRVQFRMPGVDADRRRRLLDGALRLCAGARAQLLVNGDAALARATGAGLHLPSARLREL